MPTKCPHCRVVRPERSASSNSAAQISTPYGPKPKSLFTTGMRFIKTKNSNGQDTFAYHHHDQLETPIQATDKADNIVWAASYQAFGKASTITPQATTDKPTITSNVRLPGQYEDSETGLHYNFRRYYDNETGRYVTQDPIGLEGGINLNSYVEGNPVSRTDPRGLQAVVPTPVGPILLPPVPVNINYPPPDFDPWRDTRPEVRQPELDPKVPKGPGKPNDPEGGGACRKMLQACLRAARHEMCPTPLRTPATAVCFGAYAGCMLALGD